MTTVVEYRHVEKREGEPARLVRHPRIRVTQVALDYIAYGWSAEEMVRQHPHLTLSEVHAALAYYFDHQQELDDEIKQEWDEVQRSRAAAVRSPFFVRMQAKGLL